MQDINKSFGHMIGCVSYFWEFFQTFSSNVRAFAGKISLSNLTIWLACVSQPVFTHLKFPDSCHLKIMQDIKKLCGRMRDPECNINFSAMV